MTDYATGSEAEMLAIREEDADLAGYPKPSDRSGPGYHSPDAPAVTLWVADVRKHPTQNRYAYPVPAEKRDALAARLADKLPAQAIDRVLAAGPLDPDWTPAEALAQVKGPKT